MLIYYKTDSEETDRVIAWHDGFSDMSSLYPGLSELIAPKGVRIPEDMTLPVLTDEQKWAGIRGRRDLLLLECDWTQLPDSPLDTTTKDSWATYRQELRDITDTYTTPDEVVWPTPPS